MRKPKHITKCLCGATKADPLFMLSDEQSAQKAVRIGATGGPGRREIVEIAFIQRELWIVLWQ